MSGTPAATTSSTWSTGQRPTSPTSLWAAARPASVSWSQRGRSTVSPSQPSTPSAASAMPTTCLTSGEAQVFPYGGRTTRFTWRWPPTMTLLQSCKTGREQRRAAADWPGQKKIGQRHTSPSWTGLVESWGPPEAAREVASVADSEEGSREGEEGALGGGPPLSLQEWKLAWIANSSRFNNHSLQ